MTGEISLVNPSRAKQRIEPDQLKSRSVGGSFLDMIKELLMFFVFVIIIMTDTFTERVLSKIPGAVDMSMPTSFGSIIIATLLTMFLVLEKIALHYKII